MPDAARRPSPLPFALTALIVAADQAAKALVVSLMPPGSLAWRSPGDFLWLVHQTNTGAAFSMGDGLPEAGRVAVLILLPLALLAGLCVYWFKTDELSRFQRWALCGILGGGLGNLVDRVFRPDGVVDFLSFRFYGLFGLERWPTFNVADAAVVVCGLLVAVSGFLPARRAGDGG